MASTIRIKRSGTSGNPTTLGQGELAYSYLPDNGSNGGDRLYIGTGTEIAGNAVNHEVIGGKYFTDKLDHELGTLTASSALLVDADKKINEFYVDNIFLDGNTISTLSGGLTFNTSGNEIDLGGVNVHGVATPIHDSDAVNKSYADGLAQQFTVSVGADNGTLTYTPFTDYITYVGGTAITTLLDSASSNITFNLDDTAVTPGSYGSQTAIPTFTVDQQGRITAAGTVDVATQLTINDDAISLLDSDVTFTATGNGLTLTYTPESNTIDYAIADATTSTKGVASFNDADFTVTDGDVTLDDDILKTVSTDSGTATTVGHNLTIQGNAINGLDVTAVGSVITVTPRTASYTQYGTARFVPEDFQLNSGEVSIDSDFIRVINTDSGAVTPLSHTIALLGGEGINVLAQGQNIEIAGEEASTTNKGVASFSSDDFDVSNGEVTVKNLGIGNAQLENDGVVIGSTDVSLGDTITDLVGLTGATIDTIRIDGNKISTNSSTNVLVLDPLSGDSNGGQVLIQGDLVVQGTQTIINSTTMSVNDLNLVLADSAQDAAAANGAGITVNGANATITYSVAGDKWNTNKDLDVGGDIYYNGTLLKEYIEDHLGNNFFAVGDGLDITYGSTEDSDNTIIFSAETATYTNRGVASFDSDQFTLSSGAVTITELDGGIY
jgi:hypothetical protein